MAAGSVYGQYTNIPDSEFEEALVFWGFDTGPIDGQIPTSSLDTITSLILFGPFEITDLTGIEDFESLTYLDCSFHSISALDLSQNFLLTHLNCSSNNLSSLELGQNILLEHLNCDFNDIVELHLSSLSN